MLVPIPFVIIIKLSVSFITRLANFAPYSEGTTGAPIIGNLPDRHGYDLPELNQLFLLHHNKHQGCE